MSKSGQKTVEQYLHGMLCERGILESEADAIMASVKEALVDRERPRWGDRAADHPLVIHLVWLDVRDQALKWIDRNKPMHWARALFVTEPVGPKETE